MTVNSTATLHYMPYTVTTSSGHALTCHMFMYKGVLIKVHPDLLPLLKHPNPKKKQRIGNSPPKLASRRRAVKELALVSDEGKICVVLVGDSWNQHPDRHHQISHLCLH